MQNSNTLKKVTAFVVGVVIFTTPAFSKQSSSHPQHDDNGSSEPIPQGTEGTVCDTGVSSGFPCKNVELLSRMPLADIGGGSGADSWGWKDPDTGRYYALMARSSGTSFIDVTDPQAPVYLGNLPSTSDEKPWRDVKVYANHAYIVADSIANHGMQVFDLTRLRGVTEPQTFTVDTLYSQIGDAHNVAINEDSGFAYIVGSAACNGGFHMVDIRSPKSPVFAGCFSADGYTHDVHCMTYSGPDQDYQGAEICFASNEDSLTIVDVSNKDAPVMIGKVAEYAMHGYSHQGWLDEKQGLFFLGDELDERNFGTQTRTLMFDVRDLDNPSYSGAHLHSTSVIDHNLYVKGNYLYEANYLGGMRILRINYGPTTSLTEVGYFDTVPESDSLDFGGAWNVYPFFDNGTILVSDMSSGLFLLRASLADDAAESAPINGRLSGMWVSEGLNDQGISILVGENDAGPYLFFSWYSYLDGEPFWLVGNKAFEYGEDELSIPTYRLNGLEFVNPNGDHAEEQIIGTVEIHVHNCNDMHFEYNLDGLGSQTLELQHLAANQGRECLE
jgi:choice-of-anchor B domain-containing protein